VRNEKINIKIKIKTSARAEDLGYTLCQILWNPILLTIYQIPRRMSRIYSEEPLYENPHSADFSSKKHSYFSKLKRRQTTLISTGHSIRSFFDGTSRNKFIYLPSLEQHIRHASHFVRKLVFIELFKLSSLARCMPFDFHISQQILHQGTSYPHIQRTGIVGLCLLPSSVNGAVSDLLKCFTYF